MLYVVFSRINNTRYSRGWHIGEKKPEPLSPLDEAVEIQADCDELEHIRHNFPNLLMANRRVVTWTGDFAKFIYRHLKD